MDRELFLKLVDEAENFNADEGFLWKINQQKRIEILTKDIRETISFLDECSKRELFYASECFEELAEYFQSEELLSCVERNLNRFDDKKLYNQLQTEYNYMKQLMKK